MKVLFILVSLISFHSAFAEDYFCTKWTRQSSVTCTFAGRSVSVWARQCENPCNWNNHDPSCDIDRLCHNENPNEFESACSEWSKESSVTCNNPNTGRWEQKWVRACQKGLATIWCSDEDPNQ
jgi:hypothetical protein